MVFLPTFRYSTLYDDDDGTPKIKVVKTSTEIAKTYRQKLIDFKEDPLVRICCNYQLAK